MKRKIVGILICTLLIAVTFLPTVTSNDKTICSTRGWSELVKITASDGGGNDRFGSSADIDTYDAIVGAYFDDVSGQTNAGSAYVFTYTGSTWVQQGKLTASDAQTDDEFGFSASISGDYAIVGAHYDDDNGLQSGSAYIFIRSGSSWSQQAKLSIGDPAADDKLGRSVAIDGDIAIVGAPGKNSNQGFAYTFIRSGTTWPQSSKLGATGSNGLGASVSVSGNYVIMGAPGTNSNTGAVHIYKWESSSWYSKGKLTASDGITGDQFGQSVSIDGDYIVVGAPGHDLTGGGEGAAYIFEKPSTEWTDMTETVKITASDASTSDNFGREVSIRGEQAIVSAPDDDDNGLASGSAYIFRRTTSTWTQEAKITASDGASNDYFGWSAAIGVNFAIVGAYAEDNTHGTDAGSAYIYEWSNQPPSTPTITGPTNGRAGTSYTYTVTSSDPNGDQVSYYIDWGDNTNTDWFGPYNSGTPQTKSHTWNSQGNYQIKAKAKDVYGAESDWGTLDIAMPKNKATNYNFNLIKQIFEKYPNAFPILRQILGL